MPKIEVSATDMMESVFPSSTAAEDFIPQTNTVYTDAAGKEVARGPIEDVKQPKDWVARVASMSISIKVTPKVDDTFVSVERGMTVEVNTMDKKILGEIQADLQKQAVASVFNTLTTVIKQMREVKKG